MAVQTLNQYTGSDAQGTGTIIVAADMETACNVYASQMSEDPTIMQCTKRNVHCVLPTVLVSFTTDVVSATAGAAKTAGCTAIPGAYTLAAGTKQIFTATAVEGWTFSKWLVDGVAVTGAEGTKSVALLEIPTASAPIVIQAEFTPSA